MLHSSRWPLLSHHSASGRQCPLDADVPSQFWPLVRLIAVDVAFFKGETVVVPYEGLGVLD